MHAALSAFAACGGGASTAAPDAGDTKHDADVVQDTGTLPDAGPSTDASAHHDAQASGDGSAESGQTTPGDGGAGCTTPASMFSAPIRPPFYAGIDFSHGGSGDVTIDQIAAVDCPGTPANESEPGYTAWTWGQHAVEIDFNPATRVPYYLSVSSGYTGAVAFASRPGGAWGQHTYVVGIGTITRDGLPFVIDWTGTHGAPKAAITELADAYYATWVPSHPAEPTDCTLDDSCGLFPNDANGHSTFGLRAKPWGGLYVESPLNTSAPDMLYTFWWDGQIAAQASDAGGD